MAAEPQDDSSPAVTGKAQQPKSTNRSKVLFFKLASCAACLALVLFGWRQLSNDGSQITQYSGSSSAAMSAPAVEAPQEVALAEVAEDAAADLAEAPAAPMAASAVPQEKVVLPEQPAAASYDEVYDAVSEIYERRYAPRESAPNTSLYRSAKNEAAVSEDAVSLAAPRVNPTTAGSGAGAGVSSTNVQVEGIDEADLIKTDGVYLYHYRFDQQTGGAQVSIIAANGLKLLSTIELPDFTDAELYVSGNRLILVQTASEDRVRELLGTLDQTKETGESGSSDVIVPDYIEPDEAEELELIDMVETVVYDLSDRKNPKEIANFQQDGSYVSSRLSGDTLYLVTNKSLYHFRPGGDVSPLARYLPVMGEDGKAVTLESGSILLPPYRENLNYAVVSALNLGSKKRETKAVLGMADQIMMSGDALFLTASIPAEGEDVSWWNRTDTGVTRFVVSNGALGYLSSGRVPGLVESQFSLDEYNGNLRIATTSRNEKGESVNNLYVYNQKMEKIGGVENLAPGERIYSARFLGDTAYLVTYRQVDPLFVIDLSNPQNPVVKGQLKIPGFSEYLHPIDGNTLLGFGQNTVATQWGGSSEDGLKLSLFDVTNPTDPREISSYLLGNAGSTSEVLNNHKAFLYDPQRRLVGFPATIRTSVGAKVGQPWSGDNNITFSGYLLMKVNADGFELYGTLPSEGGDPAEGFNRSDPANAIDRGVYIGNTFYTVASGRIRAYSLDGLELIGELAYTSQS